MGSGYVDIRDFHSRIDLHGNNIVYLESTQEKRNFLARAFALLGLFDAAGILTYIIKGGEKPEIFIRVNSYYNLQKVTQNYHKYNNIILENVWDRHENSVRFLDYLFSNITNQTDKFWSLVESYFLGIQPNLDTGIEQELVKIERISKAHTRLLSKREL